MKIGKRREKAFGDGRPLDRNEKAGIVYRAERMERASKPRGGYSGAIGQTGLAILRCLLFRFARDAEPSYKAIRTATGFAFSTIADALHRLEAVGLVIIERRKRRTAAGNRVINNRYTFPPEPDSVPQGLIPADVERKFPFRLIPYEQWESPVKDALEKWADALQTHLHLSE